MLINIGKGIEMDVDVAKLPADVLSHVQYIGLRNILMDAHSGVTKEKATDVVAESRAVSEKKLAAMYAGQVRATSAGRTSDPIAAEMKKIATGMLKDVIRKAGKKMEDYSTEQKNAAVAKLIDKNPSIRTTAEKNVAATKELSKNTADLSDLI